MSNDVKNSALQVTKYKILGLDCPNCAKTLEGELCKINCVDSASIDFVKQTLTVKAENQKLALDEIKRVTKSLEPDVSIIEPKQKTKSNAKAHILVNFILLLLGIIVGVIALFVKMPVWLKWTLYVISALAMGYKTYIKAIKLLFRGVVNENLLVTISIIGAFAVGEHMDGLMVIALYSIGKILESLALNKSKKSIEELTKLKPDYAVVLRDGKEEKVDPSLVEVDEVIIVKPGERVALDGIVLDGKSSLDMQSLSGESIPVNIEAGENILSGSIVLDGVLKIKVTSKYSSSTISRIMDMIENASEKKSKTETVISKISRYYAFGVIILAFVVFGIVYAVTADLNVAVYRGLIFLVVSCPCAFAISVPLAYFSGIGNASRNGILIKGSNYLDALAKVSTIAFDKTGTLTTGKFLVVDITSLKESYSKDQILKIASIGEQYSVHPLAKSIVQCIKEPIEKASNVKEVAGEGVYYCYNDINYFVGRRDKTLTGTVVELYENNEKIGQITLADTIKHSALELSEQLKDLKCKTVLLSGDNPESVKQVASAVKATEYYSNLLPQDKYNWIEKNKGKNGLIGYVGDGINDAPSLMLSDVGISMGINGSPASIEASDIVLVDDNPQKIISAIKISKCTRKIVYENIILSAIIKVVFLTLGAVGVTGMLAAVIADVGVTLVAILNSLRALYYNPHKAKNKKQK